MNLCIVQKSDGTARDKSKVTEAAAAMRHTAVENREPTQLDFSEVKEAVREWMTSCDSK